MCCSFFHWEINPQCVHYRYRLITEQKKGSYRLFYDAGDQLEPVSVRTTYVDEVSSSGRCLLPD